MKENTAKETLKNTGLVGGSKIITILIGVVSTKFIAIFLGPGGIGIIQLLSATIALVNTIFGLGLGFSGVRDISENIKSGDTIKTAKTIVYIKRWVWFSGIIGVVTTILLSKQLSSWAFGNTNYWTDISLLSVTIIISNLGASYAAIIRSTRRMADFAKTGIISGFITTAIAIPVYYFFREKGIVPVLVFASIISLITNLIYSKKSAFPKVKISLKESFYGGIDMVQLGIFTVITGFMAQATRYYVRIFINDELGLQYVGFYAVATTLAVTYMGLIFAAMGADYFPKLSAINKDNVALNKAILEQTKVVLLLGTPLVIGMYTFSEYIILVMYSKEFVAALPLLLWMLLSVFLRLVSFPIGLVFLAKGKSKIYIFTQSLWNGIFLLFLFIFWKYNGNLESVGIAFSIAHAVGVVINILVVKRLTSFKYDNDTLKYISIFLSITLLYFYLSYAFDGWLVLLLKVLGGGLIFVYCFKKIEKLIDLNLKTLIKSKLMKQ